MANQMVFLVSVSDNVCHVIADGVEIWVRPEHNLIVIKTDGSRYLTSAPAITAERLTIEVSPRLEDSDE